MLLEKESKVEAEQKEQELAKSHLRKGSITGSFKLIHELDCIYWGEINRSYQREGFGVLQTIDFDMYFGFWKNNKAEGKGLIVLGRG